MKKNTNERKEENTMKTNNESILEERQRIQNTLESLYRTAPNHIITVNLTHTSKHNPCTDEPEPYIKCVEERTKEIIGWIPEAMLSIPFQSQVTGYIKYDGKGKYYVNITKQKAPTAKQYHFIKGYCEKNHLAVPAYDIRAYYDIFKMIRAKKSEFQKIPA